MVDLSLLNPEQRTAAAHFKGPLLILAGAGSGKTRTITFRIAYLVQHYRVDPRAILAVSFTNKAAQEMRERVAALLPMAAKEMTLSTFHALCTKILQQEIHHLGYSKNFSIYDTSDQLALVGEALRHYKAGKQFDRKEIQARLSFLKNQGITCGDQFLHSRHFDHESDYDIATEFVFNYYSEKLHFYNAIDFDDILLLTVKLFDQFPEIARKYSTLFQFIMIDEYQDTNPLQFKLVAALTSAHQNICVVGDDDQSIYGFRGADISNILEFEKKYPGTQVIKLEENYRSTKPILNLANAIIRQNKKRKDKTMRTQLDSPTIPELWCCADSDHEAESVVEDIKKELQNPKVKEIAVIYRGNNQAPAIEDILRMENLTYTLIGGQKFYEKKEVKDIIAYLCVLNNPSDELSLRRILNVPQRGIGPVTLGKFLEFSAKNHVSLLKAMQMNPHLEPAKSEVITQFTHLLAHFRAQFQALPLDEALSYLISKLNFFEYIEKVYGATSVKQVDRRKRDLIHFIESAKRFALFNPHETTLAKFLERLLLTDNQDKSSDGESEETGPAQKAITLLTLHSSKGLEFDLVYLVGMEEELLPHKKSIQGPVGDEIAEECRLCYVGITRARKRLIMTYCKERELYGRKAPRFRSRFIEQLKGQHFVEFDRSNYEHLSREQRQEQQSDYLRDLISSLRRS